MLPNTPASHRNAVRNLADKFRIIGSVKDDKRCAQGRNCRRCSLCNVPGTGLLHFMVKYFSLKAQANLFLLDVTFHQ